MARPATLSIIGPRTSAAVQAARRLLSPATKMPGWLDSVARDGG
jgi:hypothetical protein